VLVPEAAVHEDDLAVPRQDQVGGSWKIAPMQPEPVAERVHRAAHRQLGLRVLLADAPHNAGAGGGVDHDLTIDKVQIFAKQWSARARTAAGWIGFRHHASDNFDWLDPVRSGRANSPIAPRE
jgi:hypothetical protein